ncbi:MAG TPA: MFS transporter [Candidatus Cloacimonadota bacterium]|nr:MFS transporter [Candidatus Cloacimonadota bacterium]
MHKQNGITRFFGKTFFSLRNYNYRLFFIGQTISNTGNWLTNVALILLVLKLTGSGLAVGILSACQFGPMLFLSAWAGAIADRSDKRKLLLLTQTLEMLQSVGLAILAFMPHPPMIGLFILATWGGILLSFDNPLRRSFVSEMVPEEDIPNAVVLYSTIINVSRILGPTLAGILIVTLGYGLCFTMDAISYLAVLICLYIMRTNELHREPPKPRTKGEVREGIRYVISLPTLWISFGMLLAIGMLSYNFRVTLPLFVTRALHSTESMFTILYSIFSFGAVICALFLAHRSVVHIRHIVIGSIALGLSMIALSLVPWVVLAFPVIFIMGMSSILYMTSTTTLVQVEAKPEMRGRVLALQTVLNAGTTLLGGPFSGWLADAFGGRAPIMFGGIISLAAADFGYYYAQKYRIYSQEICNTTECAS